MLPHVPTTSSAAALPPAGVSWRSVTWPKEHGSWSLALEPIALGLIAAPSLGGVALSAAVVAGFFARRPLKIVWSGSRPDQRATARGVFAILSVLAGAAGGAAVVYGGTALLPWLVAMSLLAGAFLYFDLRNEGREGAAELAGAAAFALSSGALATAAGWSKGAALAIAVTMLGRAVPTIQLVRSFLRAAKGAAASLAPAVASTAWAAVIAILMAWRGLMPWLVPDLLVVLCLRALLLAACRDVAIRARTLGFIELGLGTVYVVTAGLAWRYFANA